MSIDSADELGRYRKILEYSLGAPFFEGNSIQLLVNGDAIFPQMLGAIQKAEYKIEFMTYVYWQGQVAKRFAELLSERAKSGVNVKVLLDAYGAKKMDKSNVELMLSAGVSLRWFRPLSTWRIWRSDKRTHRKLLICDDSVGFTGGVGIADEWRGDARSPDEWRETHVCLQGPCLQGLHAAFLDNWNEAGEWESDLPGGCSVSNEKGIPIQVMRSSTTVGWTDIASMMRVLIELAQDKLYITAAYFVPDDVTIDRLCKAVERNVDVRILTAGQYTDSRLSQLAGQCNYDVLLNSGVKIWCYDKTLLHAKVITVDRYVSCIGSANMNHRSLGKDEECSFIALDHVTVSELDKQFLNDCDGAAQISTEAWNDRGFSQRAREQMARLFVEQL